jgi:hypothetical protein
MDRPRRRAVGSLAAALLLVAPSAVVLAPAGPLVAPASAEASTTAFGSGECTQEVSATGDLVGAVAADGDDCVIVFTGGSGDWVVPVAITGIRYLVVGGGGGGGSRGGGGGGALHETSTGVTSTPGAAVAVVIGAGGAAGSVTAPGANGAPSVFDAVTAYGGGGGTSTRQYDRDAARNALPDPVEGTDLAARPVFVAEFTTGAGGSEGGSGGGGMASPQHDWFTSTGDGSTDVGALGGRGGAGRAAGTAGVDLHRHPGGESRSILHLFPDGRVRSFWIGAGGGGAGARGGDVAWASTGETVDGVITANGSVITLTGPGLVPGAGGAGRATTLLSTTLATTFAVGEVADGAVHFAGGGAGWANYHNPRETGEAVGDVASLLVVRDLVGHRGVGGGGGGGATAAGGANTGGGGRGGAAGGSGVVLVRYTRVAQAPLALGPSTLEPEGSVDLTVTGGSGSGEVTVELLDTDGACTLDGTTLTATDTTGTCTVTVTRAADASHVARTDTFVLTIGTAPVEVPGGDPGDGPAEEAGEAAVADPTEDVDVRPVPVRVNTGGGPVPLMPPSTALLLALLAALLAVLDRGREAVAVASRTERSLRGRYVAHGRLPGFDALDQRLAELRTTARRDH